MGFIVEFALSKLGFPRVMFSLQGTCNLGVFGKFLILMLIIQKMYEGKSLVTNSNIKACCGLNLS